MIKTEAIILQSLSDYGYDIFTKQQLVNITKLSDKQLETGLRNLIKLGQIQNIERGKYCRYGFADEFVIGSFLSLKGGIAYWSAMHYHGLTEQIPNTIFVQTDRQKSSKKIFNVNYRFVRVNPNKCFGYNKEGYGNHSFFITDQEKTILDSFDKPKYSGGYPEIIKALYKAKLSSEKMIEYGTKMDNLSILKRIAYISELIGKEELSDFRKFVQSILNKKYTLLEHNGNPTGKTNNKWKLILNITNDEILNMIIS